MPRPSNALVTLLALALSAPLAACGISAGGGGPGLDDASRTTTDATPSHDASALPSDDAGALPSDDAGPVTGGDDAGSTTDAAPAGEPITAPAGEWTWVDFPDSRCLDGSPTGIGVNLAPDSNDVLIFLQGGGACWDATTCWGPVSTSFYVATGYGRIEFATDVARPVMLPMRRDDPNNPFRHTNLVYVPYCTGDVHAGDNVVDMDFLGTTHRSYFRGARNLGLFLQRLTATFPRAHRVWLSGDSAGGFGSALNMDRVQQAFPWARVDVMDDSGQPIEPDPARWAQWRTTWNLQTPADCRDCADNVSAFVDYYRGKYPHNRFGLISYTNDAVITTFMGLPPTTFYDELTALASNIDHHWPTAHYYFLPGALHVGYLTPTPGLVDWLNAFVNDDPSWDSYTPF